MFQIHVWILEKNRICKEYLLILCTDLIMREQLFMSLSCHFGLYVQWLHTNSGCSNQDLTDRFSFFTLHSMMKYISVRIVQEWHLIGFLENWVLLKPVLCGVGDVALLIFLHVQTQSNRICKFHVILLWLRLPKIPLFPDLYCLFFKWMIFYTFVHAIFLQVNCTCALLIVKYPRGLKFISEPNKGIKILLFEWNCFT
jgi:hypothetical protein